MPTLNKTLVASATATLGNESLATALTACGRAFAQGERSTAKLVKVYADAETHPAFFVSPYDNRGRINPESVSKATPEQFDAQRMLWAAGMGNAESGLAVATCAELLAYDVTAKQKRYKQLKELMSNSGDKSKKKDWSKEAELIDATIKTRSALLRKIGPKFRDLANALITEYKRRAKAKDGNEAANELSKKLKAECGFTSIKADKAEEVKADKDEHAIILQQAKNLLHALQEAEELPANGNKLIKELTALLEPKH